MIKNSFVTQIYADVAAGAYPDVVTAGAAMGGVVAQSYQPNAANAKVYDQHNRHYNELYEDFGHNGAMHSLRAIRDRALAGGNQ